MIQSSEQLQFSLLLEKSRSLIFKIINKYCFDSQQADDLYQEISLRAWSGFASFRGDSKFSTWIAGIAQNTVIDWFRRMRRQAQVVLMDNILWEITDNPYEEYSPPISLSVLDKLTAAERRTLEMRMEGKTFREISELTGEPVGRLTIRVHRIKKLLEDGIKCPYKKR